MAPRFERDPRAAGPAVLGFSGTRFVVDDALHPAVLLSPEAAFPWQPPSLAELTPGSLSPLLDLSPPPEFLILGTGATMAFAPRGLVQALAERGIGVEAMDSRAAARTWGMLRSEDRWIVAALMPI